MNLLEAMRVYVRVVERGSISAAARDLRLGQAAVSERIDRLEQHLGCRLLMRSTRSFQWTWEGETFYHRSTKLLADADHAVAEITKEWHQPKGRVRISAPHCIGETLMPRLLMHACREYPALTLDLALNDRNADLVTEGADIALRLGSLANASVIAYPLGSVEQALLAAPGFLAAHDEIDSPDALGALPFLRVNGALEDGHLPLEDEAGTARVVPIRTAITSSHWRPMFEMIAAGMGIGIAPVFACAEALNQGTLVRVLPAYRVAPLELNMLALPQRPHPSRIRVMLELFKAVIPRMLLDGH
ncbi:LysR family transcriptional regulator [Herbaspirillum sp.]|uniref:LysR family transcriptional regulator n=1 Tax=Herbaspirillum sp. TaxID=1890675 RepID=UPI0031D8A1F8